MDSTNLLEQTDTGYKILMYLFIARYCMMDLPKTTVCVCLLVRKDLVRFVILAESRRGVGVYLEAHFLIECHRGNAYLEARQHGLPHFHLLGYFEGSIDQFSSKTSSLVAASEEKKKKQVNSPIGGRFQGIKGIVPRMDLDFITVEHRVFRLVFIVPFEAKY
jgi:hypothetical protein